MALKLKREWFRVLDECRRNGGSVCPTLFIPCRIAAHTWTADTTEIEGIMNLIKICAARRSHMVSIQLLCATVGNAKDLGIGSRTSKGFRYSTLKPRVEEIVQDAREHLEEARRSLDPLQYKDPTPFTGPIPNARVDAPIVEPVALAWSSAHALMLHRRVVDCKV